MTRSTLIELSDVTIDIDQKIVRRGDDRIPLTPLEYRLFEYLAVRAGEIVSREEIARTLGGRSEAMRSNMIDVYIGYLRRKLGPAAIATKRGKGYCAPPKLTPIVARAQLALWRIACSVWGWERCW